MAMQTCMSLISGRRVKGWNTQVACNPCDSKAEREGFLEYLFVQVSRYIECLPIAKLACLEARVALQCSKPCFIS